MVFAKEKIIITVMMALCGSSFSNYITFHLFSFFLFVLTLLFSTSFPSVIFLLLCFSFVNFFLFVALSVFLLYFSLSILEVLKVTFVVKFLIVMPHAKIRVMHKKKMKELVDEPQVWLLIHERYRKTLSQESDTRRERRMSTA